VKNTLERLRAIWVNLPANSKMVAVLVTVGFVVATVVTVQWANRAIYTTLYTGLAAEEAGEIVDQLTTLGVPYRISNGGTAILVPETQVQSTRLKMAAQGYPHGGVVGYEIFDKSNLGMTDFLQKVNYRRALEGEIAKSIMSLSEVSAARVHLVIPEQRLFARDQKPPTASVVLKLNRALSQAQVSGIEHLVAASVEGLTTDHIAIVDYKGKLLSERNDGDEDARLSANQMELRKSVEHYLEDKAQSMLDNTIGGGKAVVRVIAELNFDKVEKSAEIYDPDKVAIRSEETTVARPSAEGAGSSSAITNYEISKSVERVVSAFGTISRLSVAVIVDGTYAEPAEGAAEGAQPVYQPRSAEELQKIGALVQTAVGYDTTRQDRIEVVNLAFDTQAMEETQRELDSTADTQFYYDVGKKVLLALLIAGALFYLRKVLKQLGEAIRTAGPAARRASLGDIPQEEMPPQQPQKLRVADVFAERAKGKPEEVAKIIKTMMLE
jgi:flagellar M-ring protein FliF